MARVKGGVTAHARHKKILKKAKGYFGRRKNTFRTANAAVEKAAFRIGSHSATVVAASVFSISAFSAFSFT